MATADMRSGIRSLRVLIASSNAAFRRQWIGNPKFYAADMEEAAGGADALAKLDAESWGEVLVDKRLHDLDVDEVLRIIGTRHPHLLVRVVDSHLSAAVGIADATQAVIDQASDVCHPDESVAGNDAPQEPICENAALVEDSDFDLEVEISPVKAEPLPGMMGGGPGLAQVYRLARLVGVRQTTVLITGETGTGKELVARGIHQISPRAKNPFVVVNCAAIPEQLLEAELFGHARGAFTGAVQSRLGRIHVAQGGTLFLDEVGELPLSMQAKLLRFLQDGEVQRLGSSDVFRLDVRVISATNVNLMQSVQQKQFRQDLYYRLAVFPLELPPLRDRIEDIVPLAQYFLDVLSNQSGLPAKRLSASATAILRTSTWPGNVRELQHAIERAFILAGDEAYLRASYFKIS